MCFGSNACNLLLILGLSAIIRPIAFKRETRLIEIPMCLVITIIFLVVCNLGQNVTRIEGIGLIVLFALFIAYTIFMAIKGEKFENKEDIVKEKEEEKKSSLLKEVVYVIIGVIALKFGGDFTVDNSVFLAEMFNISEKIISVTILAIRNKSS